MHGSPQLAPLRVLQRALFPPARSLARCWFVAAADCMTERVSWAPRLTEQTKQKYWLFKPDDTVNTGKVKQLCIRFISSRMLLKSIGHASLC